MEWVQLDNICDMMVFLSSVLGIPLEARLFGGLCVSLYCGLCGKRRMLGFSRTFGRHWR